MASSTSFAFLKKQIPGYFFLLPGFAFIFLFMGYPLVQSLVLSFTHYNFAYDAAPTFAGIDNYLKIWEDSYFLDALRNTMVFSVVFFPAMMIFSLFLAVLLEKGVRGSSFFRTSIFLPVVIPLSLTGIIFQWILNDRFGLLNQFLTNVGLGAASRNWLGDDFWAMASIIVVSVWKYLGILVILFLAGLQAIPTELYEAADIDGCSGTQKFFWVTLPNLRESFILCGMWTILQSVKVFEQPFIMTNGGPGTSTLVLYQYSWQNAFKFFEMGYASTIAYIMGLIILVLSFLNFKLNQSR
jgi:ABC-type sugar transport system permease subunit